MKQSSTLVRRSFRRVNLIRAILLVLMAPLLLFFQNCSPGFNNNNLDLSQYSIGSNISGSIIPIIAGGVVHNTGPVNTKVIFTNGLMITAAGSTVSVEVQPILQTATITSVDIYVMGLKETQITSAPFIHNLNLIGRQGPLLVEALATFSDQTQSVASLVINLRYSGGDGTIDSNCFNNSAYNACLFWKNPVAQDQHAFAPRIKFGDNLDAVQTYGVQIKGLSVSSQLRNTSIQVSASAGITASPLADGSWKHHYSNDQGKSYVAQLMAYYWLTEMETIIKTNSGSFYASGKGIPVDAYNSTAPDAADNAYFTADVVAGNISGPALVMGALTSTPSSVPFNEVALGAEVYLHEMGHANLAYASPQTLNPSPLTETTYANTMYPSARLTACNSYRGCISAIHEGQADFHTVLIFSQSPILGQHFLNSLIGFFERDPNRNTRLTATNVFRPAYAGAPSGEVHDMGALYYAILWTLYNHPQVIRLEFVKIFEMHLAMLGSSSTFADGKIAMKAVDVAHFAGKYSAIIDQVFAARGL